MTTPSFYLASQSPRRRKLLRQWGYNFKVFPNCAALDLDESPYQTEDPFAYVSRASEEKAKAALKYLEEHPRIRKLPILTADTIVVLEDTTILRKPTSRKQAYDMLKTLSGENHTVMTAVTLIGLDGNTNTKLTKAVVNFVPLSEKQIEAYLDTGEPFDKAGGYGIQGQAALFVESINGSYTGVMGLPGYATSQLLARFGIHPNF